MVVTGNLLDLEETAKAPLSTVSANTTNTDEPLRPQALNSSSVVWVSGHGAWGSPLGSNEPRPGPWIRPTAAPGQALAPTSCRPLGGPDPRAASPTGLALNRAVSSQFLASWPEHPALPTAGPAKGPLVLTVGLSLLMPLPIGRLNEEPETRAGSLALDPSLSQLFHFLSDGDDLCLKNLPEEPNM